MCGGDGGAADRAAAEAARQDAIEKQRLADEAASAKKQADEQYAAQQKQYADQLAQQKADAEAMRQAMADQAAATLKQQQDIEAQREAERNADLASADKQRQEAAAAAAGKAAALTEYNTGRQSAVDKARSQVEGAFAGFDDNYYKKVAGDYTASALPQLDQQYDDAKRSTTFGFADKGSLNSTGAARTFGRLDQTKTAAGAQIAQDAQTAANGLRSNVDTQKASLLNSVFGAINSAPVVTADNVGDANSSLNALTNALSSPVSLANSAAGTITPPAFNSLTNVFAVPPTTAIPKTTFGSGGSSTTYGSTTGSSGRLVS